MITSEGSYGVLGGPGLANVDGGVRVTLAAQSIVSLVFESSTY